MVGAWDQSTHGSSGYTAVDRQWAEWIAWELEEAGYTTILQAWDFAPGSHFVTTMHLATQITERTIAVLSRAYLDSAFSEQEWQAAWAEVQPVQSESFWSYESRTVRARVS
jgi:TIR domain-containing protein